MYSTKIYLHFLLDSRFCLPLCGCLTHTRRKILNVEKLVVMTGFFVVGGLLGQNSLVYKNKPRISGIGWHKLFRCNSNCGLLNLSKEWYSGKPAEALIYFSYYNNELRQLAGKALSDFITKMRIAIYGHESWVEVYYNMETENPLNLSFSALFYADITVDTSLSGINQHLI